jgi:hypothetical protein
MREVHALTERAPNQLKTPARALDHEVTDQHGTMASRGAWTRLCPRWGRI